MGKNVNLAITNDKSKFLFFYIFLDYCCSVLFNKDNGILSFLRKTATIDDVGYFLRILQYMISKSNLCTNTGIVSHLLTVRK